MSRKIKKSRRSERTSERILLLGKYFRKTDEGLILSSQTLPELGEKVYDQKLREVGYVSGVFGKCDNFFVVVKCPKNLDFPLDNEYFIIREERTDALKQKLRGS